MAAAVSAGRLAAAARGERRVPEPPPSSLPLSHHSRGARPDASPGRAGPSRIESPGPADRTPSQSVVVVVVVVWPVRPPSTPPSPPSR